MSKISDDFSEAQSYPPVGSYAFISECHSVALISRATSIDWCCMPRIDSSSCFGRILDWSKGGYCRLYPLGEYNIERQYHGNSLILETTFHAEGGIARLSDCFTMREGGKHNPHKQILRVLEGIEGEVRCECIVEPRFDYGEVKPWIRQLSETQFTAIGGSSGLLISGDLHFKRPERHSCSTRFTVKAGERVRLSIMHRAPELLDEVVEHIPDAEELDRRLEETKRWWDSWSGKGKYVGQYARHAHRSAVVLKGLCNSPTGAIAAAATTSLPEEIGGVRNWDYRFSWIRDSVFTLRSLNELGYNNEAEGFRRFIERSSAGSAEELQVLYGVGGERKLEELTLDQLDGYRESRPIRIGNGAVMQTQLDIYGELLELSWRWQRKDATMDDDYWTFITELVERAIASWQDPDCGIWEIRDKPRHFVLSKAMCWVAIDRALKLAHKDNRDCPEDSWRLTLDEIRSEVMEKGVDKKRGVFIQAFDYEVSDASLLLLPVFGFVDFEDELMIRTTDAIREDLEKGGLIRRYASGSDELPGTEGTFIACTFWLVECMAMQGRIEEARNYFENAIATANDLGLFSEEFDVVGKRMLGNFPQALTHMSHITALVALNRTVPPRNSLEKSR